MFNVPTFFHKYLVVSQFSMSKAVFLTVTFGPEDLHFPRFRSFDWFELHSWSRGVIPSADGKDQESTSEELNLLWLGTCCLLVGTGGLFWGKTSDLIFCNMVLGRSFFTWFVFEKMAGMTLKDIVTSDTRKYPTCLSLFNYQFRDDERFQILDYFIHFGFVSSGQFASRGANLAPFKRQRPNIQLARNILICPNMIPKF